jgi:hypothetical protein
VTLLVPSYVRKISWAEKEHLVKMEAILKTFADSNPHEVLKRKQRHGNHPKWFVNFTAEPDSNLALIAGDFLYNVRSGLDHMVAALVPSAHRAHVMFPVLREPIWDIPRVPGEDKERTRSRERWTTVTRHMHPEAVAILREAQPTNRFGRERQLHVIEMLNTLSNKDRHRTLHLMATSIRDSLIHCQMPDGSEVTLANQGGEHDGPLDGAELFGIPADAVRVYLTGAVRVVIDTRAGDQHVPIPQAFRELLRVVRVNLIGPLSPYIHGL